jgi:YbbR domain-containing protein
VTSVKDWLLHNLGLKLFSLGLAFALWFVVAGEQRIEYTLSVPVNLGGLPDTMALVNDPDRVVSVRLRGPKSLVTALGPEGVNLRLDVSQLREGEHQVSVRAEVSALPRGVEVLDVSPSRVRLVLERLAEREVPVVARVEGTPAAGHYVRRVQVQPSRVRVTGPRSEVRRLSQLYTSPVSVEGRSRDFVTRTPLEPPDRSVTVGELESVQVSVQIRGGSG